MGTNSSNFGFLADHDPLLARLGALAERYFTSDPETSLVKSRQLAELLARRAAIGLGIETEQNATFADVLRQLRRELDPSVLDLFHQVRVAGNQAAHEATGSHGAALTSLRFARQASIWFHRTFGRDPGFKPGPFVPPEDPEQEAMALREELAELRLRCAEQASEAERARAHAEQEAYARLTAEQQAQAAEEERRVWEELASEADRRVADALQALKAASDATLPAPATVTAFKHAASAAAGRIELDERETRRIIDQQLREAGWEADSERLRYSRGTRPEPGRFLAIAEWPTRSGRADYVLFAGLKPLAAVEAKKLATNVPQRLDQAQRYARDLVISDGLEAPGGPWPSGDDATGQAETYAVPFVYATNGRPYLRQLDIASGIWFRDARRPTNRRRALVGWHSPSGLLALVAEDHREAEERLKAEPFSYGVTLRDYQIAAIRAVEDGIAAGQRTMLLAMATGTGKTKTCIALVYRLLKSQRFRRILFLVDRNALGEQASGAFATTRMENQQTFADIFGIEAPDRPAETGVSRVVIATVQSMARRVLLAEERERAPTIDEFDCVVVDECHRGYLLDREMSDTELTFRSQEDYVSQYRRVLDYFDAVKVGLTATPALHTTEIFGPPTFTYSYRDAVLDGWLVDYEPPVRIETALARSGIRWRQGEAMSRLNLGTGEIDTVTVPDEVLYEVDAFNKEVIAPDFNRVVCEELAQLIDPALDGKTLVFCATDFHAELVVEKLKDALEAAYGPVLDGLIAKITGKADKPAELIRRFKNEARPKIAVTVDLLTTGIDVPEIVNLVFIRRVGSRILYEQMIGRGTRLCPEIGKETFRVFDAVGLYDALQPFNTMRPVAVNPRWTFADLAAAVQNAADDDARNEFRDQLVARLRRAQRRATAVQVDALRDQCGFDLGGLADHLAAMDGAAAAAWLVQHPSVTAALDRSGGAAAAPVLPLWMGLDETAAVYTSYGADGRPEDYLDGFTRFVRENLNAVPALLVIAQRPRELTRQDLREVERLLDVKGYSAAHLRAAFRSAKNEDAAAGIIGYVRQAALGDPLEPYAARVDRAVAAILKRRAWTHPQQQWIKRIALQIKADTVVDRAALDQGAFKEQGGGFARIDRVFDGHLAEVLGDLNEAIWQRAG